MSISNKHQPTCFCSSGLMNKNLDDAKAKLAATSATNMNNQDSRLKPDGDIVN